MSEAKHAYSTKGKTISVTLLTASCVLGVRTIILVLFLPFLFSSCEVWGRVWRLKNWWLNGDYLTLTFDATFQELESTSGELLNSQGLEFSNAYTDIHAWTHTGNRLTGNPHGNILQVLLTSVDELLFQAVIVSYSLNLSGDQEIHSPREPDW
jgi:hypothetical protein